MKNYIPDRWVVLKITDPESNQSIEKVFAGWYGGYAGNDSWKLNSGITKITETNKQFEFLGETGSTYICYKSAYGMSLYMAGVLEYWKKHSTAIFEILESYNV